MLSKWEFSGSLLHYTYQIKIAFLNALYKSSLNEYEQYSYLHLYYLKYYSTKLSIYLSILSIDLQPKQYHQELHHTNYSLDPNLAIGIYVSSVALSTR